MKNDMQWLVLNWKESSFLCVLRTWLSTAQRPWVLSVNHGRSNFTHLSLHHFCSISSKKSSWHLNRFIFFPTNQLWSMLGQDYSTCIIGVPDRRYLWIMARTPSIEENKLQALIAKSRSLGWVFGLREMEGTEDPFFSKTLNCFWYLSGKKQGIINSSVIRNLFEIQAALGRLWWQGDCSGATRGGCQLRSWRDRAFQRRRRPIRWIFDAAWNDICSWDGKTDL